MRIVTAFAVFVIIPHLLYAQTQNDTYSLSAAFQSGVLYGQAEEIVYHDSVTYPSKKVDDKLSQLLWDMKPVFYDGIMLDYAPFDPFAKIGFFANLSLKIGFTGIQSGVMEDRDWCSLNDYALTHYSRHDNITNDFLDVTVKTGSSFPLHANWLVAAYAAFAYTRFSFSGIGGSGTYARPINVDSNGIGTYHPIDDNPRREPFSGTVITYKQEWFTIAPGISVTGRFLSVLSAEAFFQISPLVFCNDMDQHFTTNTEYLDVMNGGLGIETGLSFSWAIRPWFICSLEGAYSHIAGTRGDTYNRSIGTKYYNQQGEAGAGLSLFDLRVVAKVRF